MEVVCAESYHCSSCKYCRTELAYRFQFRKISTLRSVPVLVSVSDRTNDSTDNFLGGLIILAMFINGWSVDDCANAFESLARKAFKPRGFAQIPLLSRIPIVAHILEFLMSYLADGLYPADDLEAALKDVFGDNRSILDHSHATAIGAKVGLPVTTILETDPCIFTNYNGVGTRPQDCGILTSKTDISSVFC
jgi:hypothetical protein